MATLSPFSSLHFVPFFPSLPSSTTSPPCLAFPRLFPIFISSLTLKAHTGKNRRLGGRARAVEEEAQITEEQQQQQEPSTSEQEPVVVPISPSDTLTMLFQAEGTLTETAIPALSKALEGTEGVTNMKVQIDEGIASVELKKQTTIQATGVASSLVETIQGSGFKLQTLNLSFDDEEDAAV